MTVLAVAVAGLVGPVYALVGWVRRLACGPPWQTDVHRRFTEHDERLRR